MLRINIRLRGIYGGAFPRYNEIDHLIALRGLLILWIKIARDKALRDLGNDLQSSINHVTDMLQYDHQVDTSGKLEAPKDLFEHYLNNVSYDWIDLRDLRP